MKTLSDAQIMWNREGNAFGGVEPEADLLQQARNLFITVCSSSFFFYWDWVVYHSLFSPYHKKGHVRLKICFLNFSEFCGFMYTLHQSTVFMICLCILHAFTFWLFSVWNSICSMQGSNKCCIILVLFIRSTIFTSTVTRLYSTSTTGCLLWLEQQNCLGHCQICNGCLFLALKWVQTPL